MRILALSGSLRAGSYNTALLRAAAAAAPPEVEVVLYDGLADVPAYDQDLDAAAETPAAVERLRRAFADADAVLIATPEYNGSIPGFLKNALDWVSRPLATNPLRNKPAAVVGASTGAFGAVWAQAELRKVLGLIGARVLDREVPIGLARERCGPDGELLDDEVRETLADVVDALAEAVAERAAIST